MQVTIGVDYTAAARQRAGIGRYTRELVAALLALESASGSSRQYVLFAATGGLRADQRRLLTAVLDAKSVGGGRATGLHATRGVTPTCGCSWSPEGRVRLRTVPLTDEWLARLWHRLRLPIPVETVTGSLDMFYSPDFVLPPTCRATRTLLTVHDLSFLHHPETFVLALHRYLERVVPRSVARADLVLADSSHTRSDLISLLGVSPGKVRVLYSGVDARFRPQREPEEGERLRTRYGLDERPYVLSVGTLQPRKNYIRLIHAFAILREAMPETQLAIAGGRGWLCQDIFAAAEAHGESVRLLGFVDEAHLPALYRGAALLAFPSLYEGFGLPVLEAMACGVPVVCSNVSSLPEVAGDAAVLVDPFDVGGLAEAMERVLQDADRRRDMVARGIAQAARFTWDEAARQLLAAFDAVQCRVSP